MTSSVPSAVELGGRVLHARLLAEARTAVAAMNWDIPQDERHELDPHETDDLTLSTAG
ncbi:hypothetical protein [Amycolatopsis sp. PS_44_ISF1]|uniref:hypothetical protein n=1 Tax=Amycolatopsis sp. PS_44_ISF1 TaxID=2974917 RepID=UPI0028DEE8D7|nr:hypothetical protein [Amycolatopsis sp. PS_44_ISF1]MDT8915797.1 hypothetical protein [Amycolatopsis sp. PS_44_ISF1]MDT8916201.1 hypothetical protein [Amycolatopsis sp. PS_44_ISF1]MDT8916264.1 hypothetical protein [Amycolatopsis sp. PS_44_ISF1]